MSAIKNYPQYIDAAMRTLAYAFPEGSFQVVMPRKLLDVQHALIGMVTEMGEVREIFSVAGTTPEDELKTMVTEELGDLWWYMALLDHALGTQSIGDNGKGVLPAWVEDSPEEALSRGLSDLQEEVGSAMDVVKRRVYYQAGDDHPKASWNICVECAQGIRSILIAMTLGSQLDPLDVMSANIRKLRARYPEKFAADQALCRDLDAEAEALKG